MQFEILIHQNSISFLMITYGNIQFLIKLHNTWYYR